MENNLETKCAKYLIEELPGLLCVLKQGFCDKELSGLTLQQYRLMSELISSSASTTDLSTRLAVSLPAISRMTHGLIEEGWVEKVSFAEDRRQVVLSLTKQGRQMLRKSREKYYVRLVPKLAELSDKKKKALVEAFNILDEFINNVEVERGEFKQLSFDGSGFSSGSRKSSRLREKSISAR